MEEIERLQKIIDASTNIVFLEQVFPQKVA